MISLHNVLVGITFLGLAVIAVNCVVIARNLWVINKNLREIERLRSKR